MYTSTFARDLNYSYELDEQIQLCQSPCKPQCQYHGVKTDAGSNPETVGCDS